MAPVLLAGGGAGRGSERLALHLDTSGTLPDGVEFLQGTTRHTALPRSDGGTRLDQADGFPHVGPPALSPDAELPMSVVAPVLVSRSTPTVQKLTDRAKQFLFDHFEQCLVLVLVVSLVLINFAVDYKLAFLSFYYLPIIAAGFFLGRNSAVWAAVLTVLLVAFFQAVTGLGAARGFSEPVIMYFVPWAGFLILTGYVVGTQSDQRKARTEDVRRTCMALLEMLTFQLDALDKHRRGHSFRVAERAVAIGRKLGVRADELEDLRVAGLLHELGPQDPHVARMFADFPREVREVPVANSMRAALDTVAAYSRYHELIGDDWPIDALRIPMAVKILAVADAFETLLTPTDTRPAFVPWNALEEIDHSAGRTFATDVVYALRFTMSPERAEPFGETPPLKLIVTRGA